MEDEDFEIIETDELVEGPGDDFEEVEEADYEVFKDSSGKAYKVSEEAKEDFLRNHPGAESIPDGGPYQYDESYLVEDKVEEEPTGVMDGFEVIDDGGSPFDIDAIENVLEQNQQREEDLLDQEDDYLKGS
jgi:hypothetical protein